MTDKEFLPDQAAPEITLFEEKPRKPVGRILLHVFLAFAGILLFGFLCMYLLFVVIPKGPEIAISRGIGKDTLVTLMPAAIDSVKARKEMASLEKKVDKLTHQGPYLIVNTTENKFYLYADNQLVRTGPCSTGKNTQLIAGKREFRFKTPRGVHKVLRKAENPIWAKPDWAFLEEGLPIPPPGDESRFDRYTLGDYKLEIGDGYMIHGTLYKRMIGMPVTHGCVRMLDDDIEAVFNTLPIGAKVIIY